MLTAANAVAQPLVEQQQGIDFGTLAVTANASVSRLEMSSNGVYVKVEGQFVLIASGSPGHFQFSGFPPYTTLDISVNNAVVTADGVGVTEQFIVDQFVHAEVTTDVDGRAEMELGARLNTTGSGNSYADSVYSGTTVMRIEYWHPDIRQQVQNTSIVDLQLRQISTLTISQEQSLSFGTLFARSAITEQAAFSLSPTGSYIVSEPGSTRMVSLVQPENGVLLVSGAAANYTLTISPQTEDVLLSHVSNPSGAPRFILSDLVSSPSGSGVTDVNGELLIQVGGTLKTELTQTPEVYPSGLYEGVYQLTVSY